MWLKDLEITHVSRFVYWHGNLWVVCYAHATWTISKFAQYYCSFDWWRKNSQLWFVLQLPYITFKLFLRLCCRTYTHFCWVYLGVRTCELFLCFNTFCVDFFVSLISRQEMIGDVTWPFFPPFCNVSRLCGLPYSASKMFASKLCLSFCRQNFSKRNITCMKEELFT